MTNAVDDNNSVFKISSTVKSNSVISMFYPINDVIESYVDINSLQPYHYRSRLREGSYSSDKEIIFDREKNIAIYINHKAGGKKRVMEIKEGTHDPLSVVYFLRTIPLQAGQSADVEVHDGNKSWTLVVQGVKKEKVRTTAGTFNTIKVRALIKYEGLFVSKGDVFIWFTDDEARMPVKMESKIKIGNITLLLIGRQIKGN